MKAQTVFVVGDKVKLRQDVLKRHSRSVPAHMGYTTAQFQWRDCLRKLEGKEGNITRVFESSKHVNVVFDDGTRYGECIGIDSTELEKVLDKE